MLELQPAARRPLRGRMYNIKRHRLRPANRYAIDPLQKPAAERTGGIDCKELQPSARGRLRAAGRCATAYAGNHFHHTPAAAARCDPDRPKKDAASCCVRMPPPVPHKKIIFPQLTDRDRKPLFHFGSKVNRPPCNGSESISIERTEARRPPGAGVIKKVA